MIAYRISQTELRKRIGNLKPKWLAKAESETKGMKAADKVEKSMWSEVKPIYMDLQNGKCAFCESLLGQQIDFDLVKQDVEHFRPKNGVDAWPTEKLRGKLKLPGDIPVSLHEAKGYTFLAFHELNYASSCKTCNSTLKANFFPTLNEPEVQGKDPISLTASEKPYLINPVGDYDDRPEDIITFLGLVPVPAQPVTKRFAHDRGRVTIAFFALSIRDDLIYGRALLLDQIGDKLALEQAAKTAAEKARIRNEMENLCRASTPHSNCANSFVDLYRRKPEKALEMLKIVKDYLKTYGTKKKRS